MPTLLVHQAAKAQRVIASGVKRGKCSADRKFDRLPAVIFQCQRLHAETSMVIGDLHLLYSSEDLPCQGSGGVPYTPASGIYELFRLAVGQLAIPRPEAGCRLRQMQGGRY
jgi:hypothetical protein